MRDQGHQSEAAPQIGVKGLLEYRRKELFHRFQASLKQQFDLLPHLTNPMAMAALAGYPSLKQVR